VVSVTSDVGASVSVQTAPSKPARPQAPADDQFGALLDSNTAAASNSTPSTPPDPAPRRSDSALSSDNSSRDTSATDQSPPSQAADSNTSSEPAGDDTSADATKAPGKTKDKSDASDSKSATSKSDAAKGDKTDGSDGPAAAVQAAVSTQQSAAQTATPDPNAIMVPVPVVPTDPTAAAGQAGGNSTSPLTIAAAGIAASASTAAQIAAPAGKINASAAADKTAKTDAGASTGAKTAPGDATTATDTAPTDAKGNDALIAAVDQGTPKTSFKAVATAQSQTDVSDIGQDAGKTGTAGATQNPATAATANAAAHLQAAKPQADATATDAKAIVSDRSTDAAPGTLSAHGQASAQAVVTPTDTSAQAASAVQAPLTATTSAASASTATLTATAATATAATATAVPLSGVPIEIAAAARAGKTRFDISLDPAELGRIDVRINVDRNGQVTSHLTVEKPETLSMLRQDAPQLQRALDDAGLKTGSNGLSFSLRDQSSSGQNSGNGNDNGGNARRLIIADEDARPATPVGRGYGRMLGSSSGVDIRV
jgi:flagellar hook-length control protein FliK